MCSTPLLVTVGAWDSQQSPSKEPFAQPECVSSLTDAGFAALPRSPGISLWDLV